MRIGCTGHQTLSPSTRRNVAAAIAKILTEHADDTLVGLSSLAQGADQLFAFAILAAGGELHAVIPSERYEQSFTTDQARMTCTALLALAGEVTILSNAEPNEDAYLAAGHHVADQCELLIAVWDGQGAASKGGTGDVVDYARNRATNVEVVWPEGATRT